MSTCDDSACGARDPHRQRAGDQGVTAAVRAEACGGAGASGQSELGVEGQEVFASDGALGVLGPRARREWSAPNGELGEERGQLPLAERRNCGEGFHAQFTSLLRKDIAWCWAAPQQEAFDCLNRALTDRPVLAYADLSRQFTLVTDTSKVGSSAALPEDQGQGEPPVAYASKINPKDVPQYDITELQCATAIWAISSLPVRHAVPSEEQLIGCEIMKTRTKYSDRRVSAEDKLCHIYEWDYDKHIVSSCSWRQWFQHLSSRNEWQALVNSAQQTHFRFTSVDV
ncbi:hypothetical protein ON010_g18212 [Phytophthora cinnamomi]|nr:hypothetical protein ON010_g18212 [Phytophthora cinnamomi]